MIGALHPAPLLPFTDVGVRLKSAVAIAPLATEGKLDRLAQQERPHLLRGGNLRRPHAGLGARIDRARRQRPD